MHSIFFFFLLQEEVNANNVPIEGLSIQHPQVRAVCVEVDVICLVSHAERQCKLVRPGGSLLTISSALCIYD